MGNYEVVLMSVSGIGGPVDPQAEAYSTVMRGVQMAANFNKHIDEARAKAPHNPDGNHSHYA